MSLIGLIVWLLVVGILYAIANYVITNLIPEPPQRILQIALVVIICLAIVILLLNLLGVSTGITIPKIT
jgi:hypothetical protein